jgi:Tol biopolymer transport system component/DNA-binding SARP family transcriptional activator
MIEFKMLGEIRLKAADGTELDAVIRQPKRLAVLSYLAAPAPGARHRRDLLLALFWPDLDTAHARTSLRNAIYVLRQSLGDEVLHSTGDEEISVNPDSLRTDLAVVLTALKEGRIDDALAAYGGELLPGLFPADSEGFQRWLDSERTRLKVAVSSAAVGRLNELENKKEFPQALAVARRMLEIQPDDEIIVRRTMVLHEALGDMAGGLNVFEKYRSRLAADYDAAPSPETAALADRLRSSPRPRSSRTKTSGVAETPSAVGISDATVPDALQALQVLQPQDSPRRWVIPLIAIAAISVVALIGWIRTRPAAPMTIGAQTPLTTEEDLQVEAAISPNGMLVAYAKGNVEHLQIFIQPINGGGKPWLLTTDSFPQQLVPRWSPNNDEVLFLAHNNAYASPSRGGVPRLVARGTAGTGMVHSASWSPSGDSVAIVRSDSLLVKPVEGSRTRFVGTGYQLHSCVWSPSPDAKWIACTSGNWAEFEAGPLFGNQAPSRIVLFPAAGGKPIDLTGAEYSNRTPAWSPDGRFLWILSGRDGIEGQVYSIPIGSDGHAAGEIVRLGIVAEWIGLSANRIAYSRPNRHANIWAIPIPTASVTDLASAQQVTTGTALIETLSVSPDGKWLVYDSNEKGNADIYRKSTSGGEPQRITTDNRPEYTASLSLNSNELAWQRWIDGKRRIVVGKVDGDGLVDENSVDRILPDTDDHGGPSWSPDGSAIAGWKHDKSEGDMFVVRRDAAGKWGISWRRHDAQLPTWAPDGKTIVFPTFDGRIQTVPADSGEARTIYAPRTDDDPLVLNLAWSRSPDTAYFIAHDKSGQGSIWSLVISTGERKLLARSDPKRPVGLTLATDQRRFYFTFDERYSNIWWAALEKK